MTYESRPGTTDDQFWKLMGQVPMPADIETSQDPFILPNNRILVHITRDSLDTLDDRIRNHGESLTEAVNVLTYTGLAVAKLNIIDMAYRAVSDAEKVHWELPNYDLPVVDDSTLPSGPRDPRQINVAVAKGRLADFALFETVYGCDKEVAVNALINFGCRTYDAMREEDFYIAVETDDGRGILTHPDHKDTLVLPHPDHWLD